MEALIVFITLVLCPLAVFIGIAQLKKSRGGTGKEMKASDLHALIARAVEDATAGLQARITDLEERLGDEPAWSIRERLNPEPARLGAEALSAAFDPDLEDDAEARTTRRATRA